MKKQIILKEYEFLQYKYENPDNYIDETTFNQLENFVLENENKYLKLTSKKGYGKVLQAQNFVGLIQTKDGTVIEILPKIQNYTKEKAKKILLKMLKTLKDSPFKTFNTANLNLAKFPLLEVFIGMFLDEVDKLIKQGIKKDYITKEENLKFLKGKLRLKEQIKKNYINKERFFVEYDEFLSDRVENRIIKSTLKYLYKLSKSSKNQQKIREFLFIFDEVKESFNIKVDFQKVKINRLLIHYEQALLWSKIFLFNKSFTPYKGDSIAFALLFDMNKLFESYVGNYLKKICKKKVFLQDTGKYLVENPKKLALKPDIVINDGEIIMDTKWKILSEEKQNDGISQGDLYQLYAYGTKYKNCKKLYLIYPKDENVESKIYKFKDNLILKILFFDLENDKIKVN